MQYFFHCQWINMRTDSLHNWKLLSCWRISILQVTHNAIVKYWSGNSLLLLIRVFSSEAVFLNRDEDTNCKRWKNRSYPGFLNCFWTYFFCLLFCKYLSFKKKIDHWQWRLVGREREFGFIRMVCLPWLYIDYFGANLSLVLNWGPDPLGFSKGRRKLWILRRYMYYGWRSSHLGFSSALFSVCEVLRN